MTGAQENLKHKGISLLHRTCNLQYSQHKEGKECFHASKPHESYYIRPISSRRHPLKWSDTYHNDDRSRPGANLPVPLDKEVGFRFVDDFCEPMQPPGVPGRSTDILQFEDSSDNLDDGVLSIVGSRAVVEPGAIEIVGRNRTIRIHACRIREVDRLQRYHDD